MKKNMGCLLFLSLTVFSCSEPEIPVPTAGTPLDYSQHPKHVDYLGYLKAYQQNTMAPGAVMLVAKAGEPVWAGAVGQSNLEHQKAFETETPFRIGSITKVFVSTLVLKMVEEDRLRLDDKLSQLLPEMAGQIPSSNQITVRHLLSHTAGVIDPPNQSLQYQADIVNDPGKIKKQTAEARLRKYVAGKSLLFSPGTDYSYSNAGYWLLEMVVEKVTGKRLSAVMSEKLFVPLGLSNTQLDQGTNANVARGYAVTTGNTVRDVTSWDMAEGNGNAAGGMVSTVRDLHRFYTALFGGEIISPSMLEAMQKKQLATCNSIHCEYGLGLEIWQLGTRTAFGHNGGLIGIEANALYFPETKTITVLYKNLGVGSDKSFLEKIVQ